MILNERLFKSNRKLDLPIILYEDNDYYDLENIGVFLSEYGDHPVLKYTDIYNMAKYNDTSINEMVNHIQNEYEGFEEPIFLVSEYQYYMDPEYAISVMENFNNYPMQFQRMDYYRFFNNLLEGCIDHGITHNNTVCLDYLVEFSLPNIGGVFKTLDNFGVQTTDMINQGLNWGANKVDNAKDWVGGKLSNYGNQAYGWFQNKMNSDKDFANRVNNITTTVTGKGTEALINSGKKMFNNVMDKKVADMIKNQDIGSLLQKGLAAGGLMLSNMPAEAKDKIMNSFSSVKDAVTTKIKELTGAQNSAPPEQKGIIANMIQRLRQLLNNITSKFSSNSGTGVRVNT